jgi:hydroxyacylglutathione hydrolase
MVERIITGPLHTNTYVFATGRKTCILIDPGSDAEAIWQSMERINMLPHTMVFTHGHIDHTAGASGILEHYRAKGCEIKVGIHRKDAEYLKDEAREINRSFLPTDNEEADKVFDELFGPRPKPDFYLKEGDTLPESDLTVIHTPGHTPGSICLFSETSNALFSGDSLFFDGLGRTDIQGGDEKTLLRHLRKKVFTLPPQTMVYPGHGPLSTLERETREDSFKTDHGMI